METEKPVWPRRKKSIVDTTVLEFDGKKLKPVPGQMVHEDIDTGMVRTHRESVPGFEEAPPAIKPATAWPPHLSSLSGLSNNERRLLQRFRVYFCWIADNAQIFVEETHRREAMHVQNQLVNVLQEFADGRKAVALWLALLAGEAYGKLSVIVTFEPAVRAYRSTVAGARKGRARFNQAVAFCMQHRTDWLTAAYLSLYRSWEKYQSTAGLPQVSLNTFTRKLRAARKKVSGR